MTDFSVGQTLGKEVHVHKTNKTVSKSCANDEPQPAADSNGRRKVHLNPNANYDLIQKAHEGRSIGMLVDLDTFYSASELRSLCSEFPSLYDDANVSAEDRELGDPRTLLNGYLLWLGYRRIKSMEFVPGRVPRQDYSSCILPEELISTWNSASGDRTAGFLQQQPAVPQPPVAGVNSFPDSNDRNAMYQRYGEKSSFLEYPHWLENLHWSIRTVGEFSDQEYRYAIRHEELVEQNLARKKEEQEDVSEFM